MWWPFIDGHHLLKGVDLRELFDKFDGERTFDIIDSIFVDEILFGANYEGDAVEKVRTKTLSIYNESEKQGRSNDRAGELPSRQVQPQQYTEQTDDGFMGLEAPVG